MPLIIDDEFHVFARERRLPPCALSFLILAGSWSARESRSGFVPSSMLADFSDDFAQAERTLCSAGILKRVKAGVRIVEGHGVTVVNTRDVTRDAEREEAEAARKRELERTRKQRQREKEKAEREARISAGVTPASRETSTDVPPEKTGKRKKPQVNASDVPRDIGVTSRGTEVPSRARADQDLDFDFDLDSSLVSQSSVVDAGARGASDGELAGAVIAAVREREHFDLDRTTALKVGVIAVGRRKKGPPTDRAAYAAAVIANEKDLYVELLRDIAPPLAEIVAGQGMPPDAHLFRSDGARPPSCLTCSTPENNYRHQAFRQEAAS
jgi:hypothetical protein